jgi:hypothetical protein
MTDATAPIASTHNADEITTLRDNLTGADAAVSPAVDPEAADLPMSGVDSEGRPWKRVMLDTPIDRHGSKYRSVIVKKPIGTDCMGTSLTALNQADVGALSVVLPRITSEPMLSKQEVGRMGIDDLGELAGAIIAFLLTKAVKAELGLTE